MFLKTPYLCSFCTIFRISHALTKYILHSCMSFHSPYFLKSMFIVLFWSSKDSIIVTFLSDCISIYFTTWRLPWSHSVSLFLSPPVLSPFLHFYLCFFLPSNFFKILLSGFNSGVFLAWISLRILQQSLLFFPTVHAKIPLLPSWFVLIKTQMSCQGL